MFLFSAGMSVTYAWDNEQQVTNTLYGTKTKFVPVELQKLEKQTNSAVANTVFYLFKEDGTQVGGKYVTDKDGKINQFLPVGSYYFEEMSPAVGYAFDTNENGSRITKYPFAVKDGDESVTVKAYNIRLNGSLQIRKTVENANNKPLTAEQMQTEFTFTITFSGGGTYDYRIDGGEARQITSGGTLKLCHGQTAVFEKLPVGLLYTVTETPTENYVVKSSGNRGNITENGSVAHFINTFSENDLPTDKKTTLTVTKKLAGELLESDKEKEFGMTLTVNGETTDFTLKADQSKDFEIPVGATYEVSENDCISDGFAQSVENGTGTATKSPIAVTVTNTYVGAARIEINGTKSWNMGEHTNIALPSSITLQLKNGDLLLEEKTVTPNETGLWQYIFVAPKYNTDGTEAEYTVTETPITSYRTIYNGYDIVNTYVAPLEIDPPIITKIIDGKNAPKTEFEFVFEGAEGSPMPSGSVGNQKRMMLVGGGELEFGNITFTEPGKYVYSVYELNGGKTGWKYDTAVYTVTFTVTEKDYVLYCERTIEKNKTETEGVVFTNAYTKPQADKTVRIHGAKKWVHGDNPETLQPTSIVVYLYADGTLAAQRIVTAEDDWQYTFEMPMLDKNGNEITYTVDEADVENYEKQIVGFDLVNTYTGTANSPVQPDDKSDTDAPKTGDNSHILLWFVLMIISAVGLVVTTVMGKKRFAYGGKHSK